MADTSDKAPVVNGAVWWALRRQFKRSLPAAAGVGYLSTVLSLQHGPATQVLRNLKLLGLIDEDDRPTELANRWRDNDGYAAACAEILEAAYPEELREAVPGPDPDAGAAARWFQQSRRLGEGAAGNAARTYFLIAAADLSREPDPADATKRARVDGATSKRAAVGGRGRRLSRSRPIGDRASAHPVRSRCPSLRSRFR